MTKVPEWARCLRKLSGHLVRMLAIETLDAIGDDDVARQLDALGFGVMIPEGIVLLGVPGNAAEVEAIVAGTEWSGNRYWAALRKAPPGIVRKAPASAKHKIRGIGRIMVWVDVAAWRRWWAEHGPKDVSRGAAADRLRAYVERIENVEEEIRMLQDDRKEIYGEAKSCGYDRKVLAEVVRRRRVDKALRDEHDAVLEFYEASLGMRFQGDEDDEGDELHDIDPLPDPPAY